MLTGYFERSISRGNRNLGLAGALILLSGAAFGLYHHQSVSYSIFGPQLANPNSMSFEAPTDSAGQYIRFESGRSVEIGTETTSAEGVAEKVRARFHIVYSSRGPLLVRADSFTMEPPFEGCLVPIPAEVRTKIIQPAVGKRLQLNGLRPFMLDATVQRETAAAYILVVVIIWAIGLVCLVVFARRTLDIRTHPSYSELRRFGAPAVVALGINGEAQDLMPEPGKVWFTTSWVVVPTLFGARAFRYRDLIWVHLKSSTFLLNFLPLLWSRCAVFHDRFGIRAKVARGITLGKAQKVVDALAARAPWILYGYTPQHSTGWSKDRAGMIRYVDAQRAKYEPREGVSVRYQPPARRSHRSSDAPSDW